MEKVIIFGTGKHWTNHKRMLQDVEIVFFADNDLSKVGQLYEGKPVIHSSEIPNVQYDKIIIASTAKDQIIKQLIEMHVATEKIEIINCCRLIKPNDYHCRVMSDGQVKYQLGDISFQCKTRSDFNVVQELFDDGNYYFIDKTRRYYVVDIGMNIGLASLFFAGQDNIKKVYGFEPFIATYEQAIDNFRMNQSFIQDKITPKHFGLAEKNEIKYFRYNTDFSGGMSTVGTGTIMEEDMEKVELRDAIGTLESIVNCHRDENAILKIDCEGSEYEIIKSLDQGNLLKNFSVIMMEWHMPEKNHIIEEILQRNGYRYLKFCGNDTRGFIYAML